MDRTIKLALVCALLVAPVLALETSQKRSEDSPEEVDKQRVSEDIPKQEKLDRQEKRGWNKEERDEWQQQQVELVQQQQEEPKVVQQQVEATKGGLLRPFEQSAKGEAEPYAFGYSIDGSSRSESGDSNGVVRGQYTLQGPDGSSRVVDYVADHNGFRASINTNEFGTEPKAPASVAFRSSQPLAEELALRQQPEEGRKGGVEWVAPVPPPLLPAPAGPVLLEKLEQSWSKTRDTPKAPAKGLREEEPRPVLEEPIKQQQQLPVRAAELKQLPALHRSGLVVPVAAPPLRFESATAHRRSQPRPLVRAYQPRVVAPAVYQRRPASPAQQYRRYRPAEPRPHFYADDDN